MPIIIPKDIPAAETLSQEHIFVMNQARAVKQDIRPIEIAIVNLMPTKVETEIQLMRLLGNSPLQVNITLIKTATYKPTNISENHLDKFYKTFEQVRGNKFDGMIITGAPVETLSFNEVKYWDELCEIMDYADKNVTSTLYICWGAQAALYHHYGINKLALSKKLFGIFPTYATVKYEPLLKGLDDIFFIPHSRHTEIDHKAVGKCEDIEVIAGSKETGAAILKSGCGKRFYFTGHSEYDRETLHREYMRDKNKGLEIDKPVNYYEGDKINMSWSGTANLLFYNWLNYYVYQTTPFDL